MPSIPQSLLWISLVVLWLFVLVPMLISKRDAVRRTSDVALATRVLNSSRRTRLLRRGGPAAGHRWGYSPRKLGPNPPEGQGDDPDWQPSDEGLDDEHESTERSVVVAEADVDGIVAEPDYLDVDVVDEDAGALPVGASAHEAVEEDDIDKADGTDELALEFEPEADEAEHEPEAEYEPGAEYEPEPAGVNDEYEYVADSSGLEAPSDAELQLAESLSAARRRRYESKTAAAVSVRKYKFRRRLLMFLAVAVVASAAAAFTVAPVAWWACGAVGAVTLLYLVYLRRQTRIEERLRRRRAQRMARSRLGVENTGDQEFDLVPSRLRRPGSVVLEIDDEDPIFEHLDYAPFARDFDLPRAAGQ
jgi:hypothetical protein